MRRYQLELGDLYPGEAVEGSITVTTSGLTVGVLCMPRTNQFVGVRELARSCPQLEHLGLAFCTLFALTTAEEMATDEFLDS